MTDAKIDQETVNVIRNALLIGLASYGEIERLYDLRDCLPMDCEEFKAVHPTASGTTVSEFAAALRALEYLNPATSPS